MSETANKIAPVDEILPVPQLFLYMPPAAPSFEPGSIASAVPLARPRADDVIFKAEFNEIKRHCFEHIRRESTHAFAQQQQA